MKLYRIVRLGTLDKYRIEYWRVSILFGRKWKPYKVGQWTGEGFSREVLEFDNFKDATARLERLRASDWEQHLRDSDFWVVAP